MRGRTSKLTHQVDATAISSFSTHSTAIETIILNGFFIMARLYSGTFESGFDEDMAMDLFCFLDCSRQYLDGITGSGFRLRKWQREYVKAIRQLESDNLIERIKEMRSVSWELRRVGREKDADWLYEWSESREHSRFGS